MRQESLDKTSVPRRPGEVESIQLAARLRLNEWLAKPNTGGTDAEALALANAARHAARRGK